MTRDDLSASLLLTLLFPVRFMVLPSPFSQVIGVLASRSPHVTFTSKIKYQSFM